LLDGERRYALPMTDPEHDEATDSLESIDPTAEHHVISQGVPDRPLIANPALLAITIIGPLLAITGVILWTIGANLIKHDQMVADYEHAFGLDAGVNIAATSPQIDADQAMIWWGIALLALGVLLIVARLIIAAVRRPA
jgi:hypothetical protein